jgi:hypothetical protein
MLKQHRNPFEGLRLGKTSLVLLAFLALLTFVGRGFLSQSPAVQLTMGAQETQLQRPSESEVVGRQVFSYAAINERHQFVTVQGDPDVVLVYDSLGTRLYSLPEKGGDFVAIPPSPAAWLSRDSLIVLDSRSERIGLFYIGKLSGRLSRTIKLPIESQAMCTLGRRIFVYTESDGGKIVELSSGGALVREFPRARHAVIPLLQMSLHQPLLLCSEPEQSIIAMEEFTARLESYSLKGDLRWSVLLSGYKNIGVEQPDPGRLILSTPPTGFYQALRAFELDSSTMGIQLGLVTRTGTRGKWSEIRTYVIDSSTGKELFITTAIPEIIGASRGRFAVLGEHSPVVTVRKYSIRH